MEEAREAGRSLMKKEKSTGPKTDPCGTPRRTPKKATFMILKNHASAPIKKERLSLTSKARMKATQNNFEEKGGVPDRIKSFREVDCSENSKRSRIGFVEPIQNGLRKI